MSPNKPQPEKTSHIHWNSDLIRRYDLSGPRYTSYPTAPQFKEGFSEAEVEAAIERSNASARPLSLYFHIPFCDTICYYCGCNKIVTANKARARPYLDSLLKEIELRAAQFDSNRPVNQLHWGGGTPTYISDDEKRELMAATRKHFNLLEDDTGEYSIEIHPGGTTPETLRVLRELGFNRLSMGVQDFDPQVQKAVNRFNSVAEVKALVDVAREENFHSLSMDLIYGLPHQSVASVSRTLEQVIALDPDRLSLFNYAHMPHLFKTQKQMDENALPSADEKLKILETAINQLTEAGYVYIGMDHFAKPDDALSIAQDRGELQRNFQGYATHGNCDMLAMGVSSISAIDNIFVQNFKDIPSYSKALDEGLTPISKGIVLTQDDLIRQTVINQLICNFELNFSALSSRLDIDFGEYFADALNQLTDFATDGLVELTPDYLKVTDDGRLLIRRICMAFDAYINPDNLQVIKLPGDKASGPARYSRII